MQEIDDPYGTHCTTILTVPLRDREDPKNQLPRAILQVIDKKDDKLFTEWDA